MLRTCRLPRGHLDPRFLPRSLKLETFTKSRSVAKMTVHVGCNCAPNLPLQTTGRTPSDASGGITACGKRGQVWSAKTDDRTWTHVETALVSPCGFNSVRDFAAAVATSGSESCMPLSKASTNSLQQVSCVSTSERSVQLLCFQRSRTTAAQQTASRSENTLFPVSNAFPLSRTLAWHCIARCGPGSRPGKAHVEIFFSSVPCSRLSCEPEQRRAVKSFCSCAKRSNSITACAAAGAGRRPKHTSTPMSRTTNEIWAVVGGCNDLSNGRSDPSCNLASTRTRPT